MKTVIDTNTGHKCVSHTVANALNEQYFLGFYSVESARKLKTEFTIGVWRVKEML